MLGFRPSHMMPLVCIGLSLMVQEEGKGGDVSMNQRSVTMRSIQCGREGGGRREVEEDASYSTGTRENSIIKRKLWQTEANCVDRIQYPMLST